MLRFRFLHQCLEATKRLQMSCDIRAYKGMDWTLRMRAARVCRKGDRAAIFGPIAMASANVCEPVRCSASVQRIVDRICGTRIAKRLIEITSSKKGIDRIMLRRSRTGGGCLV